jgi:toxin ParE1/3/4
VSLSVRFHPEASSELLAEASYYEAQAKGLGLRFTTEVQAAIRIAAEFPGMGAPFKFGTRRVFPKNFPFSIAYRILVAEIVVMAIVPDARKPGYWRDRSANI